MIYIFAFRAYRDGKWKHLEEGAVIWKKNYKTETRICGFEDRNVLLQLPCSIKALVLRVCPGTQEPQHGLRMR